MSAGNNQAATYTVGQFAGILFLINSTAIANSFTRAYGAEGSIYLFTSTSYHLSAGDTVKVQSTNSGVSPSFGGDATTDWFSITRTGN